MSTLLRYTIQPDDTYWKVADAITRCAGVNYEAIEAANPGVDAENLQTGQEIVIPPCSGSGGGLTYTIQPDDTYWEISQALAKCKSGITEEQLEQANPGYPADDLQTGEVIRIPAPGSSTEEEDECGVVGYWQQTWSSQCRAPVANANIGVAFSGCAEVSQALEQSSNVTLQGDAYLGIGGGDKDGFITRRALTELNKAITSGQLQQYKGIAYDVEEGERGLQKDFAKSFAIAKQHGLQVLVTTSHNIPYGIPDAAALMHGFFKDQHIDYLSPQLYTSGEEGQNDYSADDGIDWSDYAACHAAVVPSIVRAEFYQDARDYFAQQGVQTRGFIQWQE